MNNTDQAARIAELEANAEKARRFRDIARKEAVEWYDRAERAEAALADAKARERALMEALTDAVSVLAMCERPAVPDPAYHGEVKALGRRIGFGAMMSTASAAWRETLIERGYPSGGEFVAGPAYATVTGCLARARSVLGDAQ